MAECQGNLYHKSLTTHNISDFHPIALLNVEGKLFFSLVSRRLEKHLINNKFINKSVQKGCMEKVPGCWEHISMVWAALKEAKSKNLSLATIWLDIANAHYLCTLLVRCLPKMDPLN